MRIDFSTNSRLNNTPDYQRFIHDLAQEKELWITAGYNYCNQGVTLNFISSEGYLTAKYYFDDWKLYGDWYTITGTYLHNNYNTIVKGKYRSMITELEYEGYDIYSKME